MIEQYKDYIELIAKESGFIPSTLEKVERLIKILEWINKDSKLNKLLALKGGTAINIALFNFPRLSVDIDLDLIENITKEEMILQKENIHKLIIQYLNANEYKINVNKSKSVHALDSIVAEYIDIKGNHDNIKIEINYMNRVHILDTKQLEVCTDIFKDRHFIINCINPIEIYASKICALLDRTTARDLFDIYTLAKYNLFDKNEKKLLRQCFMLHYIAICNYKLIDMKIDNIEKIKKQDIKQKLLPTLKDRNPQKSDIEVMKKEVRKYLEEILIVDDNVKEFYEKFTKGVYEPELLFQDALILGKVKSHPMIIWKLSNNTLN